MHRMRARSFMHAAALAGVAACSIVAASSISGCRTPAADIEVEQPSDGEPSGRGSESTAAPVFVEAPAPVQSGPELDWTAVDDRYAGLIEGERFRIDYGPEHPWIGSTAPLVTIVVFHDYQCPYSGRLDDTIAGLLQQYGDRVRVVWRQLPLAFHPQAALGARYALAAQAQGNFAVMHAQLFAHAGKYDATTLAQDAAALGLDLPRLLVDVDSEWIVGLVDADLRAAAAWGVNATPTMFINGLPQRGAIDSVALEAVVVEELAVAERLLAAGSPPRELWARFLAASQPGPVAWAKPPAANPSPTPATKPKTRFETKLAGLPKLGPSNAKIEILMCGDFDCPFSKRSLQTLDELRKRHPNDLSVSFRHMPLPMHTNARPAHRAAVAADLQGQFWPMFEALYADQSQRSDAELEALASQLGLDLAQFRTDMASTTTEALIDQQSDFCQRKLDAHGTPTFYVNGWLLAGAQPVDAFEAIITEELAATP